MKEQSSGTHKNTIKKFETERELVDSFVHFSEKTRPHNWQCIQEFEVGLGIADIVFAKQVRNASKSIALLQAVSPRLGIFFSESYTKQPLRQEDFEVLLGTNTKQTKRIINQIRSLPQVKARKDQSIEISFSGKPPFAPIISIEAKLSDWRRALLQAFRYTQYSHESWVLLDTANTPAAIKELRQFKRTGIGLASFSTDGQLFIHQHAKLRKPSSEEKFWRAQALISRTNTIKSTNQSRP